MKDANPTHARLDPRARYERDPEFHLLVDTLYGMIHACQYTPTELREAVILAAWRYECYNVRPLLLSQYERDTALQILVEARFREAAEGSEPGPLPDRPDFA